MSERDYLISKAGRMLAVKTALKNASLPSHSKKQLGIIDRNSRAAWKANRPQIKYDARGNVTNPSHELW